MGIHTMDEVIMLPSSFPNPSLAHLSIWPEFTLKFNKLFAKCLLGRLKLFGSENETSCSFDMVSKHCNSTHADKDQSILV